MRRWTVVALVIVLAGCSGGSDSRPAAASGSLAELAARNVATTARQVPPPAAPVPSLYESVSGAVRAGELSILDADRILMPLFFGDDSAVPSAYRSPAAVPGVPDLALFWILQRLPSYPPAERAELEAFLPKNRARAVAAAASRWNLFAPVSAYAVPPQPTQGSCESITQAGDFINLGENDISVAGHGMRLAVCGKSPDDLGVATDVYFQAVDDLNRIGNFFQGQGVDNLALARAPQVQIFLTPGAPVTRAGDEPSDGYMASCRDIAINQTLPQCEVEASVRHELFHCLHMRSQGFSVATIALGDDEEQLQRGTWWGRVPDWVSEGSAVWAEDRFDAGVQTNDEWGYHLSFAEVPHVALDEREYSSGIFFNLVEQHLGDASMRQLLAQFVEATAITGALGGPDADKLQQVVPWPDTWYDFADAASGYQVLFDQGRPELQDFPAFPYEAETGCEPEPVALGQEHLARHQSMNPYEGLVYDLDAPHLSVVYEIIDGIDAADAQYIDVGFSGKAAERIAANDNVRVTAILRTMTDDRVENWSERWLAEAGDSGPITIPPDLAVESQTDGRLRLCLTDEAEGCFTKPDDQIYRGLYEIDIIIANAGFGAAGDITGAMVLVPGAMPGWKGKRVETRPGYEEDQ